MIFSFTSLILASGYAGIFVAVFAESGFFLGFFLPGDSLLFTLGIIASRGHLDVLVLIPVAILAAIAGDSFGYWTGATLGRRFLEKRTGRFLKPEYLENTERFFAKHGRLAVFLARFVPVVRTFTPIFAGIGEMNYGIFLVYNVLGGIIWTTGFLTLAYFLGRIPAVRHYTSLIIIAIVILSIVPIVIGWMRAIMKKGASEKVPHEKQS